MITYDSHITAPTFDDFLKAKRPDLVDIGENDISWLRVSRSKALVEFVSKQTGKVAVRCPLDEASTFGASPAQVSAARQALTT